MFIESYYITPAIILLRMLMGLSFYDESSLAETIIETMRFGPDDPNSIPKSGIVDEKKWPLGYTNGRQMRNCREKDSSVHIKVIDSR